MLRKFVLVSLASSVFGGVIGGLVASATTSQASPRAIAAAVEQVQDRTADRLLLSIANSTADANIWALPDLKEICLGVAPASQTYKCVAPKP